MKNFVAFLKKELLESVRTYKLLIILTVFFVFGMMSPLTAKLLPEILSSFMPEGIKITIIEPTAVDAWAQFFKNISQLGLFMTVILFSGILSTELSKGTLINMLTKGLSRSAVILSKFTSMAIIWTLSYTAAFIITWGYAIYLFPGDIVSNLLLSVFCLWLFGLFLLSLLLLGATLTKSNYGCLLLTGAVIGVLMFCNIVPNVQKYSPISLAAFNVSLLTNAVAASELLWPIVITSLCASACVIASVLIFNKNQI